MKNVDILRKQIKITELNKTCWYFTEINQNNKIKYENMLIFYGNKSK